MKALALTKEIDSHSGNNLLLIMLDYVCSQSTLYFADILKYIGLRISLRRLLEDIWLH